MVFISISLSVSAAPSYLIKTKKQSNEICQVLGKKLSADLDAVKSLFNPEVTTFTFTFGFLGDGSPRKRQYFVWDNDFSWVRTNKVLSPHQNSMN